MMVLCRTDSVGHVPTDPMSDLPVRFISEKVSQSPRPLNKAIDRVLRPELVLEVRTRAIISSSTLKDSLVMILMMLFGVHFRKTGVKANYRDFNTFCHPSSHRLQQHTFAVHENSCPAVLGIWRLPGAYATRR